jgi:hypothetical protein
MGQCPMGSQSQRTMQPRTARACHRHTERARTRASGACRGGVCMGWEHPSVDVDRHRPPPAPAPMHHDGERRLIRAGRHRCRRTGAARAMHACMQSKASAALCHRSVRPSSCCCCMRARYCIDWRSAWTDPTGDG